MVKHVSWIAQVLKEGWKPNNKSDMPQTFPGVSLSATVTESNNRWKRNDNSLNRNSPKQCCSKCMAHLTKTPTKPCSIKLPLSQWSVHLDTPWWRTWVKIVQDKITNDLCDWKQYYILIKIKGSLDFQWRNKRDKLKLSIVKEVLSSYINVLGDMPWTTLNMWWCNLK